MKHLIDYIELWIKRIVKASAALVLIAVICKIFFPDHGAVAIPEGNRRNPDSQYNMCLKATDNHDRCDKLLYKAVDG